MTHMWQNANKQQLPAWDPCQHGWTVDNGVLVPVWFTCNRVPAQLFYEDNTNPDEDHDDLHFSDEEDDYTSDDDDDSDDEM